MKKISIRAILLCGLALLWMAFIWSNSAKSAVASSRQSLQVLDLLEPILLSLGLDEDTLHYLVRKAAHMAEFALLGALWAGGMRRYRFFPPFTLCFLTALVDETIQLYFPGRSGQITDLWVDLAGVALGILAAAIIGRLIRKRKKQKTCGRNLNLSWSWIPSAPPLHKNSWSLSDQLFLLIFQDNKTSHPLAPQGIASGASVSTSHWQQMQYYAMGGG